MSLQSSLPEFPPQQHPAQHWHPVPQLDPVPQLEVSHLDPVPQLEVSQLDPDTGTDLQGCSQQSGIAFEAHSGTEPGLQVSP